LFGYNRAPIFEVTHAICGENVSRGRHYYVNDALNEQRYLDLIRQSESAIQFLGTVHSHPDHGYPSGQDVASARLALQRCAFLFVVIATNYTHWSEFTLRAFFLTRGMNTLVEVGMSDGGEQNERCQPTDAIVM
jgi:proteasome lid subunit RPN8/RPN11